MGWQNPESESVSTKKLPRLDCGETLEFSTMGMGSRMETSHGRKLPFPCTQEKLQEKLLENLLNNHISDDHLGFSCPV
jgi:hypothetical protein